MKQSLGLIEIIGLPTAILVADTMVKAANIQIIEMENSRGLGYMTIKIQGAVGAVKASIDAGCQIGRTYGKLAGWKVIARPSDSVEQTFCGCNNPVPPTPPEPPAHAEEPENQSEPENQPEPEKQEPSVNAEPEPQGISDTIPVEENPEMPALREEEISPEEKPSSAAPKKTSKKTNHNKGSI